MKNIRMTGLKKSLLSELSDFSSLLFILRFQPPIFLLGCLF